MLLSLLENLLFIQGLQNLILTPKTSFRYNIEFKYLFIKSFYRFSKSFLSVFYAKKPLLWHDNCFLQKVTIPAFHWICVYCASLKHFSKLKVLISNSTYWLSVTVYNYELVSSFVFLLSFLRKLSFQVILREHSICHV